MVSDKERSRTGFSAYSALSIYNPSEKRPKDGVTKLFQSIAMELGADNERIKQRNLDLEKAIAALEGRSKTGKRLRLLAGSLAIVGTVLVSLGVAYFIEGPAVPGVIMLSVGGLLGLIPLITAFIERH